MDRPLSARAATRAPARADEQTAAPRAFTDALRRETTGTDLPRYLAVLEALVAWTAKHANDLAPRAGARADTLRYARVETEEPFWSAQVRRADAPTLEIHLPKGRPLSAEDRADALHTLNAHSRGVLVEGDRLRIGFGALKNAAALAAVLALMERLLVAPAARGAAGGEAGAAPSAAT